MSHGLSPGGTASLENKRNHERTQTHNQEEDNHLFVRSLAYTPFFYVCTGQCRSQIYACGLGTLVSNQTSQFCFCHHYTYRCYTSFAPPHIWAPVLKHALLKKQKLVSFVRLSGSLLLCSLQTHQVCTTDAKIETDATVIENAT